MSFNIAKKLRRMHHWAIAGEDKDMLGTLLNEAADEIERLQVEVAYWKEQALKNKGA